MIHLFFVFILKRIKSLRINSKKACGPAIAYTWALLTENGVAE